MLIGGRFYSSSSPDATAMAVTDGTVVWLGAEQPGRALHPDAEIIDLDGAFVAPAFVDPHVHVTALGSTLTGLDLSTAHSLEHCLELVRGFAASHPDGAILGDGWDETAWPEGRPPTVEEIDAAVRPGRQVYLSRVDAHSAVVSSALLTGAVTAASGCTRGAPLRADAHHLVRTAVLSGLDRAQRDRARKAALDAAAAHGVVAVHECGGPEIAGCTDIRELLEFEHGVEVRAYWGDRKSVV